MSFQSLHCTHLMKSCVVENVIGWQAKISRLIPTCMQEGVNSYSYFQELQSCEELEKLFLYKGKEKNATMAPLHLPFETVWFGRGLDEKLLHLKNQLGFIKSRTNQSRNMQKIEIMRKFKFAIALWHTCNDHPSFNIFRPKPRNDKDMHAPVQFNVLRMAGNHFYL